MDYTQQTTSTLQIARARLLAGLRNSRTANRAQVLRWVNEIEGELLSRAEKETKVSKVTLVQSGWVSEPIAPKAGIERITNPATGELLGWVKSGRFGWEAFDASDRFLGEYRGADSHNRAADRVWQAWEAKARKVAA